MDPASILLTPLVLLPAQVIWEGVEVTVVVSFEVTSDEGNDRPVPDKAENVDAPEVSASPVTDPVSVVVPRVNAVSVTAFAVVPPATPISAVSATPVAVPATTVPVSAAAPIPAVTDPVPAAPAVALAVLGAPAARNVAVIAPAARVPVVRVHIIGILEVSVL